MFGAAFYLTLMWALVADCIDYQEQKRGVVRKAPYMQPILFSVKSHRA